MFALLRNALGLSEELPDCSHILWQEFFCFAQQQNIAPLLVPTIARLPESQRPPRSVWIPWLAEQNKAQNKYKTTLAAVKTITSLLSSHGIPSLIFKGLTISNCYPNPSLRPFSDVDIYHFGKYKEADQLLHDQLGITIVDRAQPHTQYMYKGIMFENHYSFLNLQAIPSNRDYEQLLQSLLQYPSFDIPSEYCTPNPTFTALYMMRHIAGHFAAGGITLRHLCDWRMFLEHHFENVDWPIVNATFDAHHMAPFVDAIEELSSFNIQPSSLNSQHSQILSSILSPLPPHSSESFTRLFWKIRRYNANRWKRSITCRDSECSLLFHSLTSHLRNPYTLLHRV